MELGYKWSLDFIGPLITISRGTKYVLVMVEHKTPWSFIALPQNSFKLVYCISFLKLCELARFGALTKVLIDQGQEIMWAFEEFCVQALTYHHTTFWNHLEIDVPIKRVVQTMKCGLCKYGMVHGSHKDWDFKLRWIAMGYQFSIHSSLASYHSYQLLYGRKQILPSAINEKLNFILDLDDL